MPALRRVCVFCGSSAGGSPEYAQAAAALGALLGRRRIGLVFGGGRVGLMGTMADAALTAGGEVIGVIPRRLRDREVAHLGLSDLRVVETMHERKAAMADLSDAFVALPGGCGTLDELFEIVTWAQLGIHAKPIGLLNVRGYFDLMDGFLAKAVDERFLRPEHRALIAFHTDPAALLAALESPPPVSVEKLLDRGQR